MDITTEDLPIAKLVRLKNGDDIIAEVVEMGEGDTISSLLLINPLKALYVPSTSTGYLQIAFMPWVYPRICDQQEFNIKREEVLLYQDVTENMNEYYWESVDQYLAAKREKVEDIQDENKIDEEVLEELLE